jgi:copper resistance protein C
MSPLTAARARVRHSAVAASIAAATVACLVLLPAAPAWAHAQLVKMSPADGSTVQVAPTRIVLTFDENIQRIGDAVVVTGPDGSRVEAGAPTVLGATATEGLRPLVYRGRYTVTYRVVSDDGHPVTAALQFTLAAGRQLATPTPSFPAATISAGTVSAGSGHHLGWLVPVAALACLGAGVVVRLRVVRRNR